MILFFFKDLFLRKVKKSPSIISKAVDDINFPIEPAKRRTVSSIYLLGGFTAFDKNGNDITISFTPTIKQLFLLIFHTSMKEGKGVSSVKLGDTLWFDKTGTSVRNNRNVNISKLRVLLESIGGIELESNKSYWKINVEKDFYCDYLEVLELIKKSRSKEGLQQDELFHLIQIASYGDICPNVQTEWMDEFKVSFANEVIDALRYLSDHNTTILGNSSLQCNVAECILKFDSLNEEAIKIKCTALYRMGKKGISSHVFSLFCKEYKEVLGTDYPIPFNELIQEPVNVI
jgi:two-component SAPR family response regulator